MNIYVFTAAARRSGPVGPLSIRRLESLRRRGGPGAVETSTPVNPSRVWRRLVVIYVPGSARMVEARGLRTRGESWD